ncbi:sterigmatocystin biosynthesis fatty acid synthase subunit beta [Ceraceosorus bombacis]|uniref:Sterigmatocystin biosynthesis fatty acid synthase subunit beta n=1 Tax=Ceraceosorus bombacis TaxID=401625 RepID=A0A0P1B829_9BASI|nr:sterigmatocystin biosynthesis fatty acid synthase subunit beta [Ceraceosorus bombacis]
MATHSLDLNGLDLHQVVVATGFGEIGPYGSSRTRWEMEVSGSFTIEGCIELAWMMGFISWTKGPLKNGQPHVGWVEAKSGEPISDADVKAKYEKEIRTHTGVRLLEPELFRGYDPLRKTFMQEIEILHDLEPLDVSEEEAQKYKNEQGEKVDVWPSASGGMHVQLKKGARVLVPQSVKFSRTVAGQIPTGFDPKRFGIPEDICANVDRCALWTLIAVTEALVMSGVTDPYEFYKYVHPSQVGTAIGSGMGGMESLSKMFKDRAQNQDVQKDILQETFINTISAWTQLLLMSSSGPTLTPVGACATALQSVAIAVKAIRSGQAKIMLAGGVDDYGEEGAYEFANMGATVSSVDELARGREPSEASRPTTSSRSGFLESQGVGAQVLMSAATALELGCPIQSVVAYTSTHTDKQGRSVPAPGHGVLAAAEPLRRALAEWNLDGDSIGVISIHGTSTNANDKNESHVYHELLKHLGRTPCHSVPVIAQKWLVGHAKGGAAAWALNGLMQSILTATVPGNRNADDISAELRKFTYLLYASQTLHRTPEDLNVGLVTSFGFGQVGGIAAILHPAHLLSRVSQQEYEAYVLKRERREGKTHARMHAMLTSNSLVRIKDAPPYPDSLQDAVMINVNARAVEIGDSYGFKAPLAPMPSRDPIKPASAQSGTAITSTAADDLAQGALNALAGNTASVQGIGIDAQQVSTFSSDEAFLKRNFTSAELEYCNAQPDPTAARARRWAAKEAAFKALGITGHGAAAPLINFEVVSSPQGPSFRLHGEAQDACKGSKLLLSITHSGDTAVAVVHRVPA